MFWEVVVPTKTRKKITINMGPETHTSWVLYTCSLWLKTKVSSIMRGSTYHNVKKKDYYTWVRKRILSAICTLVHRKRSTWHPFMALVIGGAQRDVRPWQCIPLSFGNDCDHTVFVSSMFTSSVTEEGSQPKVVSHYAQVYRSQKVSVFGPMFIGLFSLFFCGYYHHSKY